MLFQVASIVDWRKSCDLDKGEILMITVAGILDKDVH